MHTKPTARSGVKIHFPAKRWNNTIIITDRPGERKENSRTICGKNHNRRCRRRTPPMSRKEPTREMKINRIMTHLEEAVEDLDDMYLDDLLSIAQQYHLLAMELHKIKLDD